jgi:hypothetical protein
MNTDIDIVTITRVLADGSHVSLGDSASTIEQLVEALDAMTQGREVIDDIFTHQTITVMDDRREGPPKAAPVKMHANQAYSRQSHLFNQFLIY